MASLLIAKETSLKANTYVACSEIFDEVLNVRGIGALIPSPEVLWLDLPTVVLKRAGVGGTDAHSTS